MLSSSRGFCHRVAGEGSSLLHQTRTAAYSAMSVVGGTGSYGQPEAPIASVTDRHATSLFRLWVQMLQHAIAVVTVVEHQLHRKNPWLMIVLMGTRTERLYVCRNWYLWLSLKAPVRDHR